MGKRGIIGAIIGACLLLASSLPALAGGLTVYNGKIETSVNPGSNNTYNMEVANTSDAPMDIGVEVKGYGMSASQDFIALEPKDDANPYTAIPLLDVSPATFHLEPGKSQVITITSSIPAGIGNGGRYAIVYIHTAASGGGAVGVISAVAARVLLTVSGSKLETTSQITEVALAKTTTPAPAAAMVTVANNGNYHYKPSIQATLRNGNKVVAATAVAAPGWPIIPGFARQFKLDFAGEAALPAGNYQVDVEVKDETGKLITKGTFPLELTEKLEVLPPIVTSAPPPPEPTAIATTSPSQSQAPAPMPTTTPTTPFPGGLIAGITAGAAIVIALVFTLGRKRRS